jgi:peptidoglycan/LPS O-acetylase OafA/YrhL
MEFKVETPTVFRKDIQILRGLSVLIVFIYHLEIQNLFSAGFIGVDVYEFLLAFRFSSIINFLDFL